MLQTGDFIGVGSYILNNRVIEHNLPRLFKAGEPVDGSRILRRIGNLHLLRFDAVGQFGQFNVLDTNTIGGSILDSQHLAASLIEVHHLGEGLESGRRIGTGRAGFIHRLDISNLLEGRNIPCVIHHTKLYSAQSSCDIEQTYLNLYVLEVNCQLRQDSHTSIGELETVPLLIIRGTCTHLGCAYRSGLENPALRSL